MKKSREKGKSERDNSERLDNLRLRAEARAVLEDPNHLSYVIVEWVRREGRDESGGQTGAFAESTRAKTQVSGIADREFVREPGESRDAFISRVAETLPAVSEFPPCICLFPPEETSMLEGGLVQ